MAHQDVNENPPRMVEQEGVEMVEKTVAMNNIELADDADVYDENAVGISKGNGKVKGNDKGKCGEGKVHIGKDKSIGEWTRVACGILWASATIAMNKATDARSRECRGQRGKTNKNKSSRFAHPRHGLRTIFATIFATILAIGLVVVRLLFASCRAVIISIAVANVIGQC